MWVPINYEHVGVVPMSVRLSVAEITCREAGAAQNAVFPTFHSVVATHFFALKTGPFCTRHHVTATHLTVTRASVAPGIVSSLSNGVGLDALRALVPELFSLL